MEMGSEATAVSLDLVLGLGPVVYLYLGHLFHALALALALFQIYHEQVHPDHDPDHRCDRDREHR